MLTLQQLKTTWFLNFNAPQITFPNIARYQNANLHDSTDGNRVTLLIDGAAYMQVWQQKLEQMIAANGGEIWHTGWRLDRVRPNGHNDETNPDALQILLNANQNGVSAFPALSAHGLPFVLATENAITVYALNLGGLSNACLELRYPSAGSAHQKFICFKNAGDPLVIFGSTDIAKVRWDTTEHLPINNDRPIAPTHEVGVMIEGPAIEDIEQTYRQRWNDDSRARGLLRASHKGPPPKITSPVSKPAPIPGGTHSIQVLRTYARYSGSYSHAYSWSAEGEFTAWAAYLHAIQTAKLYIYIEDQYFLPFGWPAWFEKSGTDGQASDIFFQLGKRIKNGVRVAVIVPDIFEDALAGNIKYQRNYGVHYLNTVANSPEAHDSGGRFVIGFLQNGTTKVYVHSKLMICDDEFVLLGTANIGQRSMSHDNESHIGIVDGDHLLARQLRESLWLEHATGAPVPPIHSDPLEAFAIFEGAIHAGVGRLRWYSSSDENAPGGHPGEPPLAHRSNITNIVDPYAGPQPRE